MVHTAGSKSFARYAHELEKEKQVPINRADLYKAVHMRSDGSPINPDVAEKIEQRQYQDVPITITFHQQFIDHLMQVKNESNDYGVGASDDGADSATVQMVCRSSHRSGLKQARTLFDLSPTSLEPEVELQASKKTLHLAEEKLGIRALRNAGLKRLASEVLGRYIEKPRSIRMGRWDNRELTPAQVQYATMDAFLSYEIGRTLNAGG
ncbi:hypothetical protein CJ030_MR2G022297 [Morella rubra]|uniref:3'-5' exonuclease domain-containing protein n=1 Tax=Morella rubra TaxID=262757 RepID=A0A6A1WEL7_9ROSI|nr:hypothetical protein CJ030_MR2G022297 [Morella rubra]